MSDIEKAKKLLGFIKNKELAVFNALQDIEKSNQEIRPVLDESVNIQREILAAVQVPPPEIKPTDLTETNTLLQEVKNELSRPINVTLTLK